MISFPESQPLFGSKAARVREGWIVDDKTERSRDGPEMFIAIVGAVGTDMELVTNILSDVLAEAKYKSHNSDARIIRLSSLLREIQDEPWSKLPEAKGTPEDVRYAAYMQAGDLLRQRLQRGDAVACLAVGDIRGERKSCTKDPNEACPSRAYTLRSLKHPDEVDTLRKIYGQSFFLIGAYSPRDTRLQDLARKIAQSWHSNRTDQYLEVAQGLQTWDESGKKEIESGADHSKFGQNVRDTFPKADVFVNTSDPLGLQNEIKRFVELLFGNPFHTPTRDEYAMFLAQAVALRSASLSRQVGAVISTEDGDIIAVGTNEVPKAGGGLYWCDDEPDYRDFRLRYDTSYEMRRNTLAEVLDRLKKDGWFAQERSQRDVKDLLEEALEGVRLPQTNKRGKAVLKDTQLMNLIEFVRAEHAEAAALIDASRRGVPVRGCNLYCTTFPCHDCARHIVAAGIRRVYYIQPYPKSLARELHMDSIAVDNPRTGQNEVSFLPYVGIAPRLYMQVFSTALFSKVDRMQEDGKVAPCKISAAKPRYAESPLSYVVKENTELASFRARIEQAGLHYVPKGG
jgi:cytidine deaminase